MSPTLRNLLGFLAVGVGGIGIYTVLPSTTMPQLVAAGINADCAQRISVCPERITPALRNVLADAGDVLPAGKRYAMLARQARRCPNLDGGVDELVRAVRADPSQADSDFDLPDPERCRDFACAVAPGFCAQGNRYVRVASQAPDCVRAPVAGGTTCQRAELDGGQRYFGAGNVFPAGEARGTGCEPVACTTIAGDDPNTTL